MSRSVNMCIVFFLNHRMVFFGGLGWGMAGPVHSDTRRRETPLKAGSCVPSTHSGTAVVPRGWWPCPALAQTPSEAAVSGSPQG